MNASVPVLPPHDHQAELAAAIAERQTVDARLRQQNEYLALLHETTLGLMRRHDLNDLLTGIIARACALFDTPNGYISLLEPAENVMRVQLGIGLYAEQIGTSSQKGQGIIGIVWQSGEPLIVDDVRTWAGRRAQVAPEVRRTVLAVPLTSGAQTVGVIGVAYVEDERHFGTHETEILQRFAQLAALALDNARLYAALQRELAERRQTAESLHENQRQLLQAEKMASLGRLTAGIAHEMNTPLAAVRAALTELESLVDEYERSVGNAQVTADDHRAIAGDMRQSLHVAATAGARAAGFVRGIKAQTRDLSERDYQRFNAVPVIEESLLLLSHVLRRANCTATFQPATENVELYGLPVRLSQVITNLVTNAVDAMVGKGGGEICLSLRRGETVELDVSDSGSGIAADVLPKIFEPMFTTKRFGEGTGLGLSIVHDIVTGEFGGTIDVRSQPGIGTTFSLRFPRPPES